MALLESSLVSWVSSVLLVLDSTALKALFRSSKTVLLMFKMQPAAVLPELKLQKVLPTPCQAIALDLAQSLGCVAKMHFKGTEHDFKPVNVPELFDLQGAAHVSAQHDQGLRQAFGLSPDCGLSCVRSITLKWVQLDSLVPDAVVLACPNLRILTLDKVRVTAAGYKHQHSCTSLQQLSLRGITFVTPPGCKLSSDVRIQLLNLPSLTALDLQERSDSLFLPGSKYYQACDRYSSQLRALRVSCHMFCWSPDTTFPLLQELWMPNLAVVEDQMLKDVQRMAPALHTLQLYSICLVTNLAETACTWRELRLVHVLVEELARLPLASCTSLVCEYALQMLNAAGQPLTVQQVEASIAALGRCGGIRFSNPATYLLLLPEDLQALSAVGPLLQHLHEGAVIVLGEEGRDCVPWPVCKQLLSALGQHLNCSEAAVMWFGWPDHPTAFAQLPQLLPQVHVFDVPEPDTDHRPAEADLAVMCLNATRRFSLRVALEYAGQPVQLVTVLPPRQQ